MLYEFKLIRLSKNESSAIDLHIVAESSFISSEIV